MKQTIDAGALDQLFRNARTHGHWLETPVDEEVLRGVYELMKMGPTSANSCPARLVFLTSREAKERLKPALSPGNVEKTMRAPVTVIVASDEEFYEKLPELYPHVDARSWFAGNEELIRETAFRNATLQGAYLILAARALGLDCGPMSGFDNSKVDEEFFAGSSMRSNFLVNLGHGDAGRLQPRNPRLEFDVACQVL